MQLHASDTGQEARGGAGCRCAGHEGAMDGHRLCGIFDAAGGAEPGEGPQRILARAVAGGAALRLALIPRQTSSSRHIAPWCGMWACDPAAIQAPGGHSSGHVWISTSVRGHPDIPAPIAACSLPGDRLQQRQAARRRNRDAQCLQPRIAHPIRGLIRERDAQLRERRRGCSGDEHHRDPEVASGSAVSAASGTGYCAS